MWLWHYSAVSLNLRIMYGKFNTSIILSPQVVSLSLQSVIQVANFCAGMDALIDQDVLIYAKYRNLFSLQISYKL